MFTGGQTQSVKFGLDFRSVSTLSRPRFETEKYMNLFNTDVHAPMT